MLMNLQSLISKYSLSIKGVIHIGAHYGQEYSTYTSIGIENMMFFEPLPDTFNILCSNIEQNENITAYNIALGNVTGEIEMNVETSNQSMSSSILQPHIHLSQYPHIVFNNKISVEIDKLDNIEFDRAKYNFINIDVQGYELEVFKGATNTLSYIEYIMTEVNKDYLYRDCVLVEELDAYLLTFGFKRVDTYWAGGNWGDALYIKLKQ
jgi:FkbM family methyltransferase